LRTLPLNDRDREHIALALRAQKGDREAFAALVSGFQGKIISFTYHFFRDRDLAEELTQETFLRVYRYIKRYNPERKFSTWVYSIARNLCIDEQRKSQRGVTVSMDDLPPETDFSDGEAHHHKDPATLLARDQESHLVDEAVRELPEKYQIALVLYYYEELPYQEIAEVLDLSLNLVKVRIFRAKKMLLQILKDRESKIAGARHPSDGV
jgi:RNA polymerase sigma-70 factor (ECF subfamily)